MEWLGAAGWDSERSLLSRSAPNGSSNRSLLRFELCKFESNTSFGAMPLQPLKEVSNSTVQA